MVKKVMLIVMFCSLVLPIQQALSVTSVEFVGGGPDVFTFSFDAAWNSAWTFTLEDPPPAMGAVPSLWVNPFTFARSVNSATLESLPTSNISFFTTVGGPLVTGTIGSFDITIDELSNFKLFDDGNSSIPTTAWNYNASTDTYTVSTVPIPGSILLLGSGLLGLVGIVRRKRS